MIKSQLEDDCVDNKMVHDRNNKCVLFWIKGWYLPFLSGVAKLLKPAQPQPTFAKRYEVQIFQGLFCSSGKTYHQLLFRKELLLRRNSCPLVFLQAEKQNFKLMKTIQQCEAGLAHKENKNIAVNGVTYAPALRDEAGSLRGPKLD
ncbi:hypothetical protein TNCV_1787561 [Trichonephila clavipes]|nr:hypothetical protein TNCV_1787561 [Trichonephila clavipes]